MSCIVYYYDSNNSDKENIQKNYWQKKKTIIKPEQTIDLMVQNVDNKNKKTQNPKI